MEGEEIEGGRWREVEGEANVWGPDVSEWRERSTRGVLVHTEDMYTYAA